MKHIVITFILAAGFLLHAYGQNRENNERIIEERTLTEHVYKECTLPDDIRQAIENNSVTQSQLNLALGDNVLFDRVINYTWDTTTNNWIGYSKEEFIYGVDGNMSEYVLFLWDAESKKWNEDGKEESFYTTNNNLAEVVCYHWDQQWVLTHKHKYTYNENGDLVEYIAIDYHVVLVAREVKEKWKYNENGNIIEHITYSWNMDINNWMESVRQVFDYNTNSKRSLYLLFYWNSGSKKWEEAGKEELIYNSNDDLEEVISFSWDHQWVMTNNYRYTYDAISNLIEYSVYFWDSYSSVWIANSKEEYTNDVNGNISLSILYDWDKEENAWTISAGSSSDCFMCRPKIVEGKKEYAYNDNGDLIQYLSYYWDTDNNHWVYANRTAYYYSLTEISSAYSLAYESLVIYPNPTKEFISFESIEPYPAMVELYDIRGRLILRNNLAGKQKLDIQQLKTGMYLYHVNQNGKVYSGKLIKE